MEIVFLIVAAIIALKAFSFAVDALTGVISGSAKFIAFATIVGCGWWILQQ